MTKKLTRLEIFKSSGENKESRQAVMMVLADGNWHPKTECGDAIYRSVEPHKLLRKYAKATFARKTGGKDRCDHRKETSEILRSSAYWIAGALLKQMMRDSKVIEEVRDVPYVGQVVGYKLAPAQRLKLFVAS